MRAAFYALDESESDDTTVVSMTGVLVPFEQYRSVCGTLIRFVHGLIPGDSLHPNPPELHGSALLKDCDWATDDHRLGCFKMIVNLVNTERLVVKRAGYFRHSVKDLLANDPKLLGLNFMNMQWMIQKELEEFFIVPIFDGLDERVGTRLGSTGQSLTALVALGQDRMLSIQPPVNMCEPFFATSRHSTLIQLADMVSYLLHARDFDPVHHHLTDFKREIRAIADTLDSDLVVNEVKAMNAV